MLKLRRHWKLILLAGIIELLVFVLLAFSLNLFTQPVNRVNEVQTTTINSIQPSQQITNLSNASPVYKYPGAGLIQKNIIFNGQSRFYWQYIPNNFKPLSSPALVIALHGINSTAQNFLQQTGFDDIADKEGFSVIYPDGIQDPTQLNQEESWNATHCCGYAHNSKTDDVGFIEQIIQISKSDLNTGKTFVTGLSNGGMMSYKLASEVPEITAIAPVAATIGGQINSASPVQITPAPSRPTPALILHGDTDDEVKYLGGLNANATRIDISPIDSAKYWAAANKCNPTPIETFTNGNKVKTDTFINCQFGQVVFMTFSGLGHKWELESPSDDETTEVFNKRHATAQLVWNFFRQYL